MCGRFTLTTPMKKLAVLFRAKPEPTLFEAPPRYNIAPSQPVLAVLVEEKQARKMKLMKWGLVPHWAKDPNIGNLINARSETAAQKPAFRDAMKYRRCIIPADGFYEWQARGKTKVPHLIHRIDGQPLGIAGLWEHWQDEHGNELETVAILTTSANELMKPIHERMPVILHPADYEKWLAQETPAQTLQSLMVPLVDGQLEAYPVSKLVSRANVDDARCSERAQESDEPRGLFE